MIYSSLIAYAHGFTPTILCSGYLDMSTQNALDALLLVELCSVTSAESR